MLPFAVLLLQATSAVLATAPPRGNHHHGHGPWVPNFKNLIAFGDSYTDESRLGYFIEHNATAPPPGFLLPSSTKTAGGGITWPRRVAEYAKANLYNYAVSGAVCDNRMIQRALSPEFGLFPDVVYEVDAFVADTKYINASTKTNTLYTDRKPHNTVYSMWIGTNDLGNSAFITDSALDGKTVPDYVDCVFDRFDSIYKAGGRYFVLLNNAPLQLSPLYGMPPTGLSASHFWPDKPANITATSSKMKEYTKLANAVFDYRTPYEVLIAKRYPGASFAVFDVNSLMTDIYNRPSEYLQAPANVTHVFYSCDLTGQKCADEPGKEIDQFMWYDELHPSAKVDEVIGHEFVKVVKGTSDYATYWS